MEWWQQIVNNVFSCSCKGNGPEPRHVSGRGGQGGTRVQQQQPREVNCTEPAPLEGALADNEPKLVNLVEAGMIDWLWESNSTKCTGENDYTDDMSLLNEPLIV